MKNVCFEVFFWAEGATDDSNVYHDKVLCRRGIEEVIANTVRITPIKKLKYAKIARLSHALAH